jgi:hypothetical protein
MSLFLTDENCRFTIGRLSAQTSSFAAGEDRLYLDESKNKTRKQPKSYLVLSVNKIHRK